jgi:hypothetical protein
MAHTDLAEMDRGVPFARDRLEAVDDGFRSACLLGLAGGTWVHALRDESSCLITFVAHRLQAGVGIGPQRQQSVRVGIGITAFQLRSSYPESCPILL